MYSRQSQEDKQEKNDKKLKDPSSKKSKDVKDKTSKDKDKDEDKDKQSVASDLPVALDCHLPSWSHSPLLLCRSECAFVRIHITPEPVGVT